MGLDQILADIEVEVEAGVIERVGLLPGESVTIGDDEFESLFRRLGSMGLEPRTTAGGTVANSLNNYTFLAGEPALLLGAIPRHIEFGDATFHYLAHTPPAVDLSRLAARDGAMGRALTMVDPGGERSFAVATGVADEFTPADLPPDALEDAVAVLVTLYCLREPQLPIARATRKLMQRAHRQGIPVAMGLGTAGLVRRLAGELPQLLTELVDIVAMNQAEARALTGESDPLLACRRALEWVDWVIVTEGPRGLTMGAWVDRSQLRQTDQPLRSKAIAEYNRYEYSRVMRRADCREPVAIYTHIHPYRGGPERLANTSGAGDAALAAVLHDVAANAYHRQLLPHSDKHPRGVPFLSYSSLSRCAQYGNRVAYEILRSRSPRLDAPVGPDL